jgi:hypothetical protein
MIFGTKSLIPTDEFYPFCFAFTERKFIESRKCNYGSNKLSIVKTFAWAATTWE